MSGDISDDVHTGSVPRPTAFQWLWYTWGGRLPQRHREWVLHDVTTRTWLWRHVARTLVQAMTLLVVVLAVLLFVVHAVVWIALLAVLLGLIVSVYYSTSYAWESADVRLTRYGYPAGHGSRIRADMADERNRGSAERYDAQWRQGSR
jgi:hypothetical protein